VAAARLPTRWRGDPLYYHTQANLLADGHGFAEPFTWLNHHRLVATAFHPPLFSVFLAIPSLLGARSVGAHQVASCLIGTAIVVVVALVVREIADQRTALVAAAMAALYPNLFVPDGLLFSEGLAALLVTVAIFLVYRIRRRATFPRLVTLGVVIGLAALTRPETILLVGLFGIPAIFFPRDRMSMAQRMRLFAAMCGTVALVLAPWLLRDLTTFHRPVLFSANSEAVVGAANCQYTYAGNTLGYWNIFCPQPRGPRERPPVIHDESDAAHFNRKLGLEYLQSHKGRLLTVVIWARLGRSFGVYRPVQTAEITEYSIQSRGVAEGRAWSFLFLLPLAAAGVWYLRRRLHVPLWPLLSPFLIVALVSVSTYGDIRFRVIAEPAFVILAAFGVMALVRRGTVPHRSVGLDTAVSS
jgi:4-amino-4-deoxy-L-arabinose transferase-like glycosyltransferase